MNLSCVDSSEQSTAPLAEATAPSAPPSQEDLSKDTIPITIPTAVTASTTPSRPPLDVICVLDTSGSMSSDNKLTNLIFAGKSYS